MKTLKRIVSVAVVFLLALQLLPAAALSEEIVYLQPMERPQHLTSGVATLSDAVVLPDSLRTFLSSQFKNCAKTISLGHFGLPMTAEVGTALSKLIFYEMTECFHVKDVSIGYYVTSNKIANFTVTYSCTAEKYTGYLNECRRSADALLDGIEGNTKLGEVEKALLVHDRLILHCEYDINYETDDTALNEAFNIYGALVEGDAVCQGYTAAYDYLLERLGMKSRFCVSEQLNHCWNIIEIGGVEYHVDATWDDPNYGDWNLKGEVYHLFFLNSSARCAQLHETTDFDQTPNSTIYDDSFWIESISPFLLVENEIYYIDNVDAELRTYSDHTVLCSVADEWDDGICYARLAGIDGQLYYSSADAFYKVDLNAKNAFAIYSPPLNTGYELYGMAIEDGFFVYDFSRNVGGKMTRDRIFLDLTAPTITASVVDAFPNKAVNYRVVDDGVIVGYYWGTSAVYSENTFYATDLETGQQLATTAGTYYLTAEDQFGNRTTQSFVFCTIELNSNGGTTAPCTVVLEPGESYTPNVPENGNNIFLGWSTDPSAETGDYTLNAIPDQIYYAIWRQSDKPLKNIRLDCLPDKTEYELGEALNISGMVLTAVFVDQTEVTVESGFELTGFDSETAGTKRILIRYGSQSVSFNVKVHSPLPFVDVSARSWYADGVLYVYRQGLMNGMTDTTFVPNETMSRAMLVTVLYRLSGSPAVSGSSSFSDVEKNRWYTKAVLWAEQEGIVNGMSSTTFEPYSGVTRAQMITILYRYAKKQGFDVSAKDDLSGFADRDSTPAWARNAMEWAVAEGIINGIAEGGKTYLRYNDSSTRAQVATVLMRYLKG